MFLLTELNFYISLVLAFTVLLFSVRLGFALYQAK